MSALSFLATKHPRDPADLRGRQPRLRFPEVLPQQSEPLRRRCSRRSSDLKSARFGLFAKPRRGTVKASASSPISKRNSAVRASTISFSAVRQIDEQCCNTTISENAARDRFRGLKRRLSLPRAKRTTPRVPVMNTLASRLAVPLSRRAPAGAQKKSPMEYLHRASERTLG